MPPVTVTPKSLVDGLLLGSSAPGDPGLYKAPASTTAVIRTISICNSDTVTRLVWVYIVVAGGTETNATKILSEIPIRTNETLLVEDVFVLNPGDFISAFASVAGMISFRADGSEIT